MRFPSRSKQASGQSLLLGMGPASQSQQHWNCRRQKWCRGTLGSAWSKKEEKKRNLALQSGFSRPTQTKTNKPTQPKQNKTKQNRRLVKTLQLRFCITLQVKRLVLAAFSSSPLPTSYRTPHPVQHRRIQSSKIRKSTCGRVSVTTLTFHGTFHYRRKGGVELIAAVWSGRPRRAWRHLRVCHLPQHAMTGGAPSCTHARETTREIWRRRQRVEGACVKLEGARAYMKLNRERYAGECMQLQQQSSPFRHSGYGSRLLGGGLQYDLRSLSFYVLFII